MASRTVYSGREAIHLLSDIFEIKQPGIRKVTVTAEVNDVCIIGIEAVAKEANATIESEPLEANKHIVTVSKVED